VPKKEGGEGSNLIKRRGETPYGKKKTWKAGESSEPRIEGHLNQGEKAGLMQGRNEGNGKA